MIGDNYDYVDNRFHELVVSTAKLEMLYDKCRWAEGPAWFDDGGFLVWSDIPNNRILRWVPDIGVGVFRAPSNYTNGNTRDLQGRLISCEHGTRRVTRTEVDGTITVIAERHDNKRLNSPNDVVVKSDGTIWFTDPPYGIMSDYEGHRSQQEQDGCFVFRVDPADGSLTVVADDFVKPNGLAFSPDESHLYVADSALSHDPEGPHHIRVFEVGSDNLLHRSRIFAEISPGVPDGLRLDVSGNIWTSAQDGVHCYSAQAELLGRIKLPQPVSNLTFGGPKRNRLFITSTHALYALYVATNGVQRP